MYLYKVGATSLYQTSLPPVPQITVPEFTVPDIIFQNKLKPEVYLAEAHFSSKI